MKHKMSLQNPPPCVMEIGKLYMMPHFEHRQQDGRHSIALNYSTRRGEGYSRILLQVPEELVK